MEERIKQLEKAYENLSKTFEEYKKKVKKLKEDIPEEEIEYQKWKADLQKIYTEVLGLPFNVSGDVLITDPVYGRGYDLRKVYFG